jgi:hypothetical protein
MAISTLSIYLLFGGIALFLISLTIWSVRRIIKNKEEFVSLKSKEDKKFVAWFFFSISAMLILISFVLLIDILSSPFFLDYLLAFIFFITLTLLIFLQGFDLIHPGKSYKRFYIISVVAILILGGTFLYKLIPEKEWLKVALIIIIMIYALFRRKLEKFYNPNNSQVKS